MLSSPLRTKPEESHPGGLNAEAGKKWKNGPRQSHTTGMASTGSQGLLCRSHEGTQEESLAAGQGITSHRRGPGTQPDRHRKGGHFTPIPSKKASSLHSCLKKPLLAQAPLAQVWSWESELVLLLTS